ncbi:hypothetical protein D3C87_197390 [compost metagenome]
MKTRILKITALCGLLACGLSSKLHAQAFTENFDDITTLTGNGWVMHNSGTPVGLIPNWIQGNDVNFPSYNGAANSYIGGHYNTVTGNNTISLWLLTPNRTFRNGDVITFYARSTNSQWSDRLQVRMSTNGASTNLGATSADVGDFTTLLMDINPTQVQGVFLNAWSLYTITISGLPAPTSGRLAFRYYVTSGGPSGNDSDYMGIDNVVYTPYTCPAFTMTAGGALTGGTAGSAYSSSLTQTGALGAPSFAVTTGALPPGLAMAANGTISGTPTATGTFNFTTTVSDASGCSGSQSYSITVVCPANPITFASAPSLCDNSSAYTLVEGSPAGGTYSGTGVAAGQFDPSAGTQTITYDMTDPYGCAHASNYTITVNPVSTVTQSAIATVCETSGALVLTGGSPMGGTYSGTGVTAGEFDPSSGTQTVTYTYTDANNCTSDASTTITVAAAPTVTQSAISAVCENSGTLVLTGGVPTGGSYSGTGVTGMNFNPTAGTQTVTYTFTDGNNCSGYASTTITVNDAPTVAFTSPVANMCVNHGPLTLSGGTPAGGTYSGTGVSGGVLTPATAGAGSHVITYSFTDANNCDGQATFTINVSACLGLDENEAFGLEVYPNPTTGLFTVSTTGTNLSIVSVMDIQGKVVSFGTSKTASGAVEVNLSNQVSGIYFVNGTVDGQPVKFRIQKQ